MRTWGRMFAASIMLLSAWGHTYTIQAETSVVASFPVKVSLSSRYLEDATGRPFLVKGDAAWSLIAQLTRDEAEAYLKDRRERGFNALLVNLLEHRFARNAPANAYGDLPFASREPFATPNENYFQHADRVLENAARRGFLIFLAPCYTGTLGTEQGWHREMVTSGADRMREYGRFVGNRFKHLPNIVWVLNGDANPPDQTLISAVADGISETNPGALLTSHNGPGTPGIALWPDAGWVTLNNVYTYGPVYPEARTQYLRTPMLPYILIESEYESGPGATTSRLRGQAYHALLTGAAGHIFGNSPIWYFDGTDEYRNVPRGWQKALNSPGSQSMALLHALFDRLSWQDLVPDVENTFLVKGYGDGFMRAVAATSASRRLAIVYVAQVSTITLEVSRLAGGKLTATWWDPTNGASMPAKHLSIYATSRANFRHPGYNAAGDADWVLLLSGSE